MTADSAAATNERPTGNRRSSEVWLKNTRPGRAIMHSIPDPTSPEVVVRTSDVNPGISPVHEQLQVLVGGPACDYRSYGQQPRFPRPLSIHVVVPAARYLIGVAMGWRQCHPCPLSPRQAQRSG